MGNLTKRIAGINSDPLLAFTTAMQWLPNPDVILRKAGKSQQVYHEMIQDPHIMSKVRDVKSGVATPFFYNEPAKHPDSARAMELCERAHALINSDTEYHMEFAKSIIADVALMGYRGLEIIWEEQDDGIDLPASLPDIANRRMIHDGTEWRLLTQNNQITGVPFPDYKLLIGQHMNTSSNPYGVAVLSSCFWPWIFKKNGMSYAEELLEKLGVPWWVIKIGGPEDQGRRDEISEAIYGMIRSGVIAIPAGEDIELETVSLEKSNLDAHVAWVNLCNAEMSKALVGQALTTEQTGGYGSRSNAETGASLRDSLVVVEPCRMVSRMITQMNRDTCSVNGIDPMAAPTYTCKEIQEENTQAALQAKQGSGNQFSVSDFAAGGKEDFTPEQQKIEELISKTVKVTLPEADERQSMLLGVIENSEDYDDLLENLVALYPELPADVMIRALEESNLASQSFGRYTVSQEVKGRT